MSFEYIMFYQIFTYLPVALLVAKTKKRLKSKPNKSPGSII